MKKDIVIPKSVGLQLAVIPVEKDAWDLYLINQNEHSLRNILVVSEASGESKTSSRLRYFLESITPASYIKFETVYGEVVQLNNTISITYYIGVDIYEKEFQFSLSNMAEITDIEIIERRGYLYE